jgi:hypothetical protein
MRFLYARLAILGVWIGVNTGVLTQGTSVRPHVCHPCDRGVGRGDLPIDLCPDQRNHAARAGIGEPRSICRSTC